MNWSNFEFMHPHFLWLLIAVPLIALWFFFNRKKDTATLKMPSTKGFVKNQSIVSKFKPVLNILRLTAITLLIIALARPRIVEVSEQTKTNKGIDIVMMSRSKSLPDSKLL